MNKETFDKKVADLWALYSAAQTLHDQELQTVLRKTCAKLGEELVTSLECKPQPSAA